MQSFSDSAAASYFPNKAGNLTQAQRILCCATFPRNLPSAGRVILAERNFLAHEVPGMYYICMASKVTGTGSNALTMLS